MNETTDAIPAFPEYYPIGNADHAHIIRRPLKDRVKDLEEEVQVLREGLSSLQGDKK